MERASNLGTIQTRLHRIAELDRPVGARRFTAAQRTHEPEEPDAGILHVRIWGPGRATARVYPTPLKDERGAVVMPSPHWVSGDGTTVLCGHPHLDDGTLFP